MKTLITSILLIATIAIHAQKTYVKITKADDVIYYPPGTKFDLKNPHGYIILKYSETPRIQEIDGDYKLIVSPYYKSGKDIIKLKKGDKVELKLTKDFGTSADKLESVLKDTNEIIATTKITNSKKLSGKKNLSFELSNGIQFEYINGKYAAKLKDDYIDIKGTYLIKTELGKLRLSFNPNDGQIWWLFEEE